MGRWLTLRSATGHNHASGKLSMRDTQIALRRKRLGAPLLLTSCRIYRPISSQTSTMRPQDKGELPNQVQNAHTAVAITTLSTKNAITTDRVPSPHKPNEPTADVPEHSIPFNV